jgi:16S rRNA processing protein RimM
MTTKVVAYLKGPFSLTGEVRLQYIETDLADYIIKNKIPLYAVIDNRTLTPKSYRSVPKGLAFRFLEIPDRTAAEALSKGDITAPIDLLPEEVSDDGYAADDLVGMIIKKSDNIPLATVQQVVNFGASDIMECVTIATDTTPAKEFTAPIIDDVVVDIDFDAKIIYVTDMIDYFLVA